MSDKLRVHFDYFAMVFGFTGTISSLMLKSIPYLQFLAAFASAIIACWGLYDRFKKKKK